MQSFVALVAVSTSVTFAVCGGERNPESGCDDYSVSQKSVTITNQPATVTVSPEASFDLGEPFLREQTGPIFASFTTEPPTAAGSPQIQIVCTGPGKGTVEVSWAECTQIIEVDCAPESSLSPDAASADLGVCGGSSEADGSVWIACDVIGEWPPSDELFSWFIQAALADAEGMPISDCTTQRHDGVADTFCDLGEPASFSVVDLDGAVGLQFAADAAANAHSFTMTTGILPTADGSFETEDSSFELQPGPQPAPWQ